jgi:hypothetical protein
MYCSTSRQPACQFVTLAGLLIAALGLYSSEASAFAKCRQPDGTYLYQNMPCGTSERGEQDSAGAAADESAGSDVMHKLIGIKSSLDPIKTALGMYIQERGNFPGKQETLKAADAGRPYAKDSIWGELGFSVNPSLPYEVASLTYIPLKKAQNGGATSFALVLALTNVDPNSIDGTLLGVSPSSDVVIRAATKARSRTGNISGGSALMYYYSCHQQSGQQLDPSFARVFSNPNGKSIVCK